MGFLLVGCGGAGTDMTANAPLKRDPLFPDVQTVSVGGKTFTAEVAATPAQHARGLMYRKSMPEDAGMLFIFDRPDTYGFYMKNTRIPLDMLWIMDGIVVDMTTMTPCNLCPCPVYTPTEAATHVLEVNAGTFDADIIGQRVEGM